MKSGYSDLFCCCFLPFSRIGSWNIEDRKNVNNHLSVWMLYSSVTTCIVISFMILLDSVHRENPDEVCKWCRLPIISVCGFIVSTVLMFIIYLTKKLKDELFDNHHDNDDCGNSLCFCNRKPKIDTIIDYGN